MSATRIEAPCRPRATPRRAVGQGRVVRALVATLMLAGIPLFAVFVSRNLVPLDARGALFALLGGVGGLLVIDLVTGIVHWACDTWGDERTPLVGPTLIRSFIEHHHMPQKMLEHDWIEVNREPALAVLIALVILTLPASERALEGQPLLAGFLASLALSGALANQLHQWAHMPRPPRLVRGLQRAGLVMDARRHARHHQPPHLQAYCIATGWLNPPLDALEFWRGLERQISRWTGEAPRTAGRSAGMERQEDRAG